MLERKGDAIRFYPTLLTFAAHCRYEPPPGGGGGRQRERRSRMSGALRSRRLLAARQFADVDDLNAQTAAWCAGGPALPRAANPQRARGLCRGDAPSDRAARQCLSAEPRTKVGRPLTVLAEPHMVRVVDGTEILACHRRSYVEADQIEDPTHIEALVADKRAARSHRGTDRRAKAAPASQTLLPGAAARGDHRHHRDPAAPARLLWRRRTRGRDPRGAGATRASPQRPSVWHSIITASSANSRSPNARQDARHFRLEAYDHLNDQTDE